MELLVRDYQGKIITGERPQPELEFYVPYYQQKLLGPYFTDRFAELTDSVRLVGGALLEIGQDGKVITITPSRVGVLVDYHYQRGKTTATTQGDFEFTGIDIYRNEVGPFFGDESTWRVLLNACYPHDGLRRVALVASDIKNKIVRAELGMRI